MKTAKNPFVWTEIYVEDMDRAKKFYETVFDIEMNSLPVPTGMDVDKSNENYFEMMAFPSNMSIYGVSGTLVKSNTYKPGAGGTLVYFGCDDCAVEMGRVAENGGKVLQDKMSIGEYGFCGICSDTEGNTIGFQSMK